MKRKALISVSDKTGVIDAAKRLVKLGFEIISTGGTADVLQKNSVPVTSISDITGFPECLDGRVKTLHPAVHAGLLAMRSNGEHMRRLEELNIGTIDVVIVNLYPFKQTIQKPDATFAEAVENIDIGGPAMLRSAAKNFQDVAVMIDPADYNAVLDELENGLISLETRKRLMYKVFQHTAVYDTLVASYLRNQLGIEFPEQLSFAYEKKEDLRYGENSHQLAAVYTETLPKASSLLFSVQLGGKQLSYNNINDANGAVELLKEFDEPAVVAVKHANPCAVAIADDIATAYRKAHDSDPVSIFGGIVACNRTVDKTAAESMIKTFLEIVIAPDFTDGALEVLRKKENLRILQNPNITKRESGNEFKYVNGGLLLQQADCSLNDEISCVTEAKPDNADMKDLLFAMKVVKHCKSNAIAIAKNGVTLGIGIGQTNRVWAAQQAVDHCRNGCEGAVLASDAYFPFADSIEVAGKAGIRAIIQPGGSVRDGESIEAANKLQIAMVFSGQRHFKH